MRLITPAIKSLVESQPVAIATVMLQGTPNVIGVAFVKVVDNQLIVTDNFMNQTIKDIQHNHSVAVVVWDQNMNGYKLLGQAKYFDSGKWVDYARKIPENKDMPAKGALVITVNRVIESA